MTKKNATISDVTQHSPHGTDRLLVGPDHEGDVAELWQVGQEAQVVAQPGLVLRGEIIVPWCVLTHSVASLTLKMQVSSKSSSSSSPWW